MKKLRTLKMSVMRGCVGFFLASAIGLVTPIAASSTSQPRGGSGGAAAFSCYSCSSQSALCGAGRVYDGQYLSRAPCTTACFLRTEPDGGTYRGCFDGWLGGLVDHKYDGCRQQHYLGHDVEWCFCRPGPAGSGEQEEEACNAGSREDVHKYAYTRPQQSPQVSSNAVARQGPADALDYNAPNTLTCFVCTDGSPHCAGEYVTRPRFVAVTPCTTTCYVHRKPYGPHYVLYRGCADPSWGQLPPPGCYGDWCFCDSALCNGASTEQLGGTSYANLLPPPEVTANDVYGSSGGGGGAVSLAAATRSHLSRQHHAKQAPLGADLGMAVAPYGGAQVIQHQGHSGGYGGGVSPASNIQVLPPEPRAGLSPGAGLPPAPGRDWCGGGVRDGLYADPLDCARFVHCVNGLTFRRVCPPGTVWHAERGYCDFPYNTNTVCRPKTRAEAARLQETAAPLPHGVVLL